MAGDKQGFRMFLDSILQTVYELVMVVGTGFHNNSPGPAVHEPVVGGIHWLVTPDGVGGMEADRHAKLAGSLPKLIQAWIVRMWADRGVRSRRRTRIVRVSRPAVQR